MTHDELVSEAKRMKSQKTITALFIGLTVGLAIWSATHKGGVFLTFGLLLAALFVGSRYSKKVARLQAEISRRNTVR